MTDFNQANPAQLLVYTRVANEESYPGGLAHSIHLAISWDEESFTPLNKNYGILFVEATVSGKNTLSSKGIKAPWVFKTSDGKYGLLGIRINEDGTPDEESRGQLIFWQTKDFMSFTAHSAIQLPTKNQITQVKCVFDETLQHYLLSWQEDNHDCFSTKIESLFTPSNEWQITATSPWSKPSIHAPLNSVTGNTITISSELCHRLLLYWNPLEISDVQLPKTIVASKVQDLEKVKPVFIYNDGSTSLKKVSWQTQEIDWSIPGEYKVTGNIQTPQYTFPLATGYGDPVIFSWQGQYYFTATNDNLDGIGLYIREANTIDGLFEPEIEQHLILDVDEKRDFVQTFWAPELHLINDDVYLFFAVSGKVWGPQCYVMKLKKGGSMINPNDWEEPIRCLRQDGSPLSETGITLDMTYFKVKKTAYVSWSYRENTGNPLDSGSMIYLATINESKPWQLTSDPVLLTRPLYGWENLQGTINNEGSAVIVTEEKVFLTYSGGAANAFTYAVGMLTADTKDNLLHPANWQKSHTPVLSYYSIEGEYGPGHNSFFTDSDNNLMITYHAEESIDGGPRCIAYRRIHFDISGRAIFNLSSRQDRSDAYQDISINLIVKPPNHK